MAIICAIHCLITPVLLVVLPILATTAWVDTDFYLWMILLVIPTTTLPIWSGCRRDRDKWVISIAALGLGLLSVALANERYAKAAARSDSALAVQLSSGPNARLAIESNAAASAACSTCVPSSKEGGAAQLARRRHMRDSHGIWDSMFLEACYWQLHTRATFSSAGEIAVSIQIERTAGETSTDELAK